MASSSRQLCIVIPQLHRRGGQERSTLELIDRLLARHWQIKVISFVCEDDRLSGRENLQFIKVPGLFLPSELFKNVFFFIWTTFYCLLKVNTPILTVGVATGKADFRVIQFFHHRYRSLVKAGKAVFPNQRSWLHRIYQNINSVWNVFLEKLLFKNNQLIAISDTVADSLLQELGIEPIKVIRHAPDSEALRRRQVEVDRFDAGHVDAEGLHRTGKDNDQVKILFVGALERKGIETVLQVLGQIENSNWHLDVVGAGDIARWQGVSQALKIETKVTFHGRQPAIPFFEKADVFFFPSLYEPFGLVVSEAISYGAVALASSECGAMELWSDRPEDFVISATAGYEKWSGALTKLLADKNIRIQLVKESQQAMFSWSWDKVADSYESLLLSGNATEEDH